MAKSRVSPVASSACSTLVAIALLAAGWPGSAGAAPSECFGKKINKVVKGNNKRVKLGFKDVAWIAGTKVTVIVKPSSHAMSPRPAEVARRRSRSRSGAREC